MRFKKIPLFGKDSSPQHTSNILALIGTLAFWLIFFIFMIVIKPKPQKPKFKEIQIVLPQDFTTQKNTAKKEEVTGNIRPSENKTAFGRIIYVKSLVNALLMILVWQKSMIIWQNSIIQTTILINIQKVF